MAIRGGADVVQLRGKDLSSAELYLEALALRRLTRSLGVPLIINDRVDIALAVDADGVHLGQDDLPVAAARRLLGPDKIIGLSTHSLEQVRAACAQDIDYLSIGPIFPTRTKLIEGPLGLDLVREARTFVRVPIVAIGGISEKNIAEVRRAGADIAAVVSAVVGAADVEAGARTLKQMLLSAAGP